MNYKTVLLLFLSVFSFWSSFSLANNMKVYGSLVNEPCTINPSDKELFIDFGEIRLLDIYERNFEFKKKEVKLVLSDCDLSLASKVKVKFLGTQNNNIPGFLGFNDASANPDLGIGFEYYDGTPVELNTLSNLIPLKQEGRNELKFYTFLKASDNGIANRTIRHGRFTATATFLFEYE